MDNDLNRALADRIRRARLAAGLTQKELAMKVGVRHQAVSLWERGARVPQPRRYRQLATALGKPAEHFVEVLNWRVKDAGDDHDR